LADDFRADIDLIAGITSVPAILEVVCRSTDMRFAAVARVTESRWVACSVRDDIAFGLKPGDELGIEATFCDTVRRQGEAVVIDHVAEDDVYSAHPIPAQYGFQSYISVPIVLADGTFFGTLCGLDPKPAQLRNPKVLGMFRLFAELIAFHIDTHSRVTLSEASLSDERRMAELREQFIAVLGHDLRNPLTAISSSVAVLERLGLDERAAAILPLIKTSAARMAALIDDVLDFARGRLGGGFPLNREETDLLPVLHQIVAEQRSKWSGRDIEVEFEMPHLVHADAIRIGQVLSNLLDNALAYGSLEAPVRLRAKAHQDSFHLSVCNAGAPIDPTTLDRLFLPFERGASTRNQKGLGLGLYIASEIAKAHGGVLDAASSDEETVFTFQIPRLAPSEAA
jgi:signal transduction histidine kinase